MHNWAQFKWMCLFESSLGKKVGIMMGELGKDRKTGFVRTWWSHSKSCFVVSDGEHWKSVRSQGNIFSGTYKVSTFSCKLASSCRITYNLENLSCQKRALGYQVREGQGILFRSFKGWRLFFYNHAICHNVLPDNKTHRLGHCCPWNRSVQPSRSSRARNT